MARARRDGGPPWELRFSGNDTAPTSGRTPHVTPRITLYVPRCARLAFLSCRSCKVRSVIPTNPVSLTRPSAGRDITHPFFPFRGSRV